MTGPMEGVRILEVAQYTFVPAAAAVLADWGADVIKVEHVEFGDAQRGLSKVFGLDAISKGSSFAPMMEGPNRGKRSIGLALDKPEGIAILHELIKQSDVFLTNFLPGAKAKLGIEVEDVRKINPNIVYARGTGFGVRGHESDKGGYDATAFWARGGSGALSTPPGADHTSEMPTGASGDNIGGMAIAGVIAAALFKRASTGETSVVDVSLLSAGAWASQFAINQALMWGGPLPRKTRRKYGSASNPLVGPYRSKDDRWVMLSMLQPGKYWSGLMEALGRPDLAKDERFDSGEKILARPEEVSDIVNDLFSEKMFDELLEILAAQEGQWAAVQDPWEVANDPSLRANGYITKVTDAEGVERELVAAPVQFDCTPVETTRAPQFAEHTDDILRELGKNDEELIELKIGRIVT